MKSTSIEKVREFWDRRPCNIRHSPKPLGTKEYYEEVTARKRRVEPHIPFLADFSHWRGKRVLEIGCGIGTDLIDFAKAGATVTTVELSPVSLQVAKNRAEVFGLSDRISFFEGDSEELARVLPENLKGGFDLVYSCGVLHHTPDPLSALREIRLFLKPGGEIRVMLYHLVSWKVIGMIARERFQFWKAGEIVPRYSEAETGCPVTYSYTRRSARKLLEEAGYRVKEMKIDHIFSYRILDYREYRYVKEWYFRIMPPPLFRFLEKHLGWHLCIKAVTA